MTMEPLLWVNGARCDPFGPSVSPLDAGFARADGVFETMRVYDGVPFELDRHLRRLHRSAEVLRISLPAKVPDLVTGALEETACSGYRHLALRLVVTRGIGSTHGLVPVSQAPTVVLVAYPLPEGAGAGLVPPIALDIARCPKNERAFTVGAKTLAYAESIVAFLEATVAGAAEALLLDTRGFVSEATTANIFFWSEGILKTPAVSCGVLEGITRAVLIDVAQSDGMMVEEGEYSPEALMKSEEIFICSSVREIASIGRLGSRTMNAAPGPVTTRLYTLFTQYVRDYVSQHTSA